MQRRRVSEFTERTSRTRPSLVGISLLTAMSEMPRHAGIIIFCVDVHSLKHLDYLLWLYFLSQQFSLALANPAPWTPFSRLGVASDTVAHSGVFRKHELSLPPLPQKVHSIVSA